VHVCTAYREIACIAKLECTQLNLGISSHRHLHLMTFCLDVRYICVSVGEVTKCDI